MSFVALNDDPGELELTAVAGSVAVGALSAMFGIPRRSVAVDVVSRRRELDAESDFAAECELAEAATRQPAR